jgi:acetyl/propionyl-CoA carboxylase alpha subunit
VKRSTIFVAKANTIRRWVIKGVIIRDESRCTNSPRLGSPLGDDMALTALVLNIGYPVIIFNRLGGGSMIASIRVVLPCCRTARSISTTDRQRLSTTLWSGEVENPRHIEIQSAGMNGQE